MSTLFHYLSEYIKQRKLFLRLKNAQKLLSLMVSDDDKKKNVPKILALIPKSELNISENFIKTAFAENTLINKYFRSSLPTISQSLLGQAIVYGEPQIVDLMLRCGAIVTINTTSGYETTPFHLSALKTPEMIDIFLERNFSVNTLDYKGFSLLYWAVIFRKLKNAEYIIDKGADVNARNYSGETALYQSLYSKYPYMCRLLCDNGATSDIYNHDSDNPLHHYLKYVKYYTNKAYEDAETTTGYEVCSLLLNAGNILNSQDATGKTPLHLSIIHNKPQAAELLLDYEANPNLPDKRGDTPLHLAVKKNDFNMVLLLLKNKANVNIENQAGMLPVHYAAINDNIKIIRLLVEVGSNLYACNKDKLRPINFAKSTMASFLLSPGIKPYDIHKIYAQMDDDEKEKATFFYIATQFALRKNLDLSEAKQYE